MVFEDEFMDKQAEIVSLFKDEVNGATEAICIFLYNDEYSSMTASVFKVNGVIVGNLDAGISDEKNEEIYNVIDDIILELEEIHQKYGKPMPVEFRLIYNTVTGAFDAQYRYEKDLDEDYECGIEAQNWFDSLNA